METKNIKDFFSKEFLNKYPQVENIMKDAPFECIVTKDGDFTDVYQNQCYSTAIYPEAAKVIYPLLGLLGEAGEVAEKIRDYLFSAGSPKGWNDLDMFLKKVYYTLNDVAITGIACGKLSKIVRDKNKELPEEQVNALKEKILSLTDEQKLNLSKELGDIGWFLATSAGDMNIKLSDIAQANLDKLQKRKQDGVLSGSGDNR